MHKRIRNIKSVKEEGKAYTKNCISLWQSKTESIAEMKKIQKKRNEYVHPKMTALDNKKDAFEMVQSVAKVLQNELRM